MQAEGEIHPSPLHPKVARNGKKGEKECAKEKSWKNWKKEISKKEKRKKKREKGIEKDKKISGNLYKILYENFRKFIHFTLPFFKNIYQQEI